jgi:hypothetical protein
VYLAGPGFGLVVEVMAVPTPWWREHQGWKIELVTERVGDAWVCQEIRITEHPKRTPPALLALDASFSSLLQALNAGEEHAKRWIDDRDGASQLELPGYRAPDGCADRP